MSNFGIVLALLGAALASLMAGIGSAIGRQCDQCPWYDFGWG